MVAMVLEEEEGVEGFCNKAGERSRWRRSWRETREGGGDEAIDPRLSGIPPRIAISSTTQGRSRHGRALTLPLSYIGGDMVVHIPQLIRRYL